MAQISINVNLPTTKYREACCLHGCVQPKFSTTGMTDTDYTNTKQKKKENTDRMQVSRINVVLFSTVMAGRGNGSSLIIQVQHLVQSQTHWSTKFS